MPSDVSVDTSLRRSSSLITLVPAFFEAAFWTAASTASTTPWTSGTPLIRTAAAA